MTRRERLERKAERRREWASKREASAAAGFKRAHAAVEHIPFGQPILVGHHSERRHRADLARHDAAMRSACESQDMAEHHAAKAAGIERQLERSVFSDDPDAIEQLQAKIEAEEKHRDLMKAANAIVRRKPKNERTPEKVQELVALGLTEAQAVKLFEPDFCGRYGFPDYELTNTGASIRRMKERIEYIKTLNERKEAAEESASGVVIEGNDWVRITFSEKPDRSVLTALKEAGFRWGQGSWSGERAKIPACVLEKVEVNQPQE